MCCTWITQNQIANQTITHNFARAGEAPHTVLHDPEEFIFAVIHFPLLPVVLPTIADDQRAPDSHIAA
jgi:hypothetical protein